MAQLAEGDVITKANGRKVTKPEELTQILGEKKLTVLFLERRGSFYFVPLEKG